MSLPSPQVTLPPVIGSASEPTFLPTQYRSGRASGSGGVPLGRGSEESVEPVRKVGSSNQRFSIQIVGRALLVARATHPPDPRSGSGATLHQVSWSRAAKTRSSCRESRYKLSSIYWNSRQAVNIWSSTMGRVCTFILGFDYMLGSMLHCNWTYIGMCKNLRRLPFLSFNIQPHCDRSKQDQQYHTKARREGIGHRVPKRSE